MKDCKLANDKIVFVGLRDIDEGEKKLLRELGITAYTMQHIDKFGIGKVMEMTLDQLCHDVSDSTIRMNPATKHNCRN